MLRKFKIPGRTWLLMAGALIAIATVACSSTEPAAPAPAIDTAALRSLVQEAVQGAVQPTEQVSAAYFTVF